MRIMYYVPYDVIGGAETQLSYLIKELKSEHSISVLYSSAVPAVESWVRSLGVLVVKAVSPNDITKAITSFRPDIFQFYHSHYAHRAIKRLLNRPKIIEVIHNRHHFSFDATTYPKNYTDICVCVSPDAESNFKGYCPDVITTVIPNGVDTDRFNDHYMRPGRDIPLGGYAGRLEGGEGKGVGRTLKALADMKEQFEFTFIGQDLGSWHKENKSPKVKFKPHTNKPEDFYKSWDFFISASPNEGFGLSIAEAVTCGVPSVVWNCGGVCHYLKHEEHALIANTDEEFRRYIKLVVTGKWKPKSIPDFSHKAMALRYNELYKELASQTYKIDTIAICPKSWTGVRESISRSASLFLDPSDSVRRLTELKPRKVIFGGFNNDWIPIAKAAHNLGAEVEISIQHTPVLNCIDQENSRAMAAAISAYKQGFADKLSSPHEGMVKTLDGFGFNSELLKNSVDISKLPKRRANSLPGIHIGVFGTGAPWKNMETQIIAAGLFAKTHDEPVHIHVNEFRPTPTTEALGIILVQHGNLPRPEFLDLLATMDIVLSVSLTETFGYLAVESYMIGIPCVCSLMVAAVSKHVGFPAICFYADDPKQIAESISNTLEDSSNIVDSVQKFLMGAGHTRGNKLV